MAYRNLSEHNIESAMLLVYVPVYLRFKGNAFQKVVLSILKIFNRI
jgi:hypothetical protein